MRPVEILRAGDQVRIGFRGREVAGVIKLASPNGHSLMLEFEAMLGGYVGMMPCLWDSVRGEFLDLIGQEPIAIRRTR